MIRASEHDRLMAFRNVRDELMLRIGLLFR